MSAFDDLERQLRGAVRKQAAPVPAGRRRWRIGRALALAAALVVPAGGVATAAGMLSAAEPVRVSALKERPPAQVSERLAASPSLKEFDAAPAKARSARAPAGQAGPWALVPASDGACLIAPSGGVFCAPAKAVNAGRLLAIRASDAMPETLSPSQIRHAQAGKPIEAPFSLAGSTVTGVAPDEAVAVALLNDAGQTLAKSSVVDNLYGVSNIDMSAVATVRLIHADGSGTSTRLR